MKRKQKGYVYQENLPRIPAIHGRWIVVYPTGGTWDYATKKEAEAKLAKKEKTLFRYEERLLAAGITPAGLQYRN
jgi:hypothetical protein